MESKEEKIDIAFCINKKYVNPCKVLMSSILEFSKSPVIFHILSTDLNDDDKGALRTNHREKKLSIEFYTPSFDAESFIIRQGDRVSVETYFRFFLPELLKDVHTVLYMDVDIVCLDDLTPLFDYDLTKYPCAMIPDFFYSDIRIFNRLEYPPKNGYFNAGVMLINLDYWRKNSIAETLISYVKQNPQRCLKHDQDAINAVLNGKILELPTRYNFQHSFFNIHGIMNKYTSNFPNAEKYQDAFIASEKWNEIATSMDAPVLIHFCTNQKPWHKECTLPFTKVWREFQKKEFGKIKLSSCYFGKKRIKVAIHKILAFLGIMQKIQYGFYDKCAYKMENDFLSLITPPPIPLALPSKRYRTSPLKVFLFHKTKRLSFVSSQNCVFTQKFLKFCCPSAQLISCISYTYTLFFQERPVKKLKIYTGGGVCSNIKYVTSFARRDA